MSEASKSWTDLISSKAKDLFSNYSDVLLEAGLKKTGFIAVGEAPKSNLTAEQVAKGERGAIAGLQAIQPVSSKWMIPSLIIGGFLLLALIIKRR